MSGVGLSVSVSSWGPSGSGGSRLVDGGAGMFNGDGWSLCLVMWAGLSTCIGSERIRVRHAHASLTVEQENAGGARTWILQCGAREERSWIRSAVAVCWLTCFSVEVRVLMR